MAVLDSIFAQARATPDKTAAVHNGHALGYRRFAALVSLGRDHLAAEGVGRDRLAVLCVHSLIDGWIIGLALRGLGVTTVNARSMTDLAAFGEGPVSLISTPTEATAWPGLAAEAARIGAPLFTLGGEVFANWEDVDLEKSAIGAVTPPGGHILLTSGTTGIYKKVLMDAAAEALDGPPRAALFGFDGDSVVNVFDFGLWTSVGHNVPVCAWTLGATVGLQQGPYLRRFQGTPGMTHALTTPHMLAAVLESVAAEPTRDDAVILFVGAGALSLAQWRAARERLTDDVRTWIGSTETGAFCATPVLTPDDLVWHRVDPARVVQVVDERDEPLATGQPGLVRVRPLGVAGYLDDPDATGTFFREGWFYSGDLGILGEDGRLSLRGRVTDVINVMGDKIATLPIETQLQDALGAVAVCVFSAPGESGEEVHVAIQPGRSVAAAELKVVLEASLPRNVQARIHAVGAFPRNHMGKIDRAELRRRLLAKPAGPR